MKKLVCFCKIFAFLMIYFISFKVQAKKIEASPIKVEVYFVLEPADYGSAERLITPSSLCYLGKSATLLCPDGKEIVDTISEENKDNRIKWRKEIRNDGVYEGYEGNYCFELGDSKDLSKIVLGTYTLTKFDCPEGYEVDEVRDAYDNYQKSISITQEEMQYLSEYFKLYGEGYLYPIYIPLKPKGTVSNYYELPPKAELEIEMGSVYRKKKYLGTTTLYTKGNWTNQFWYAEKEDGEWKKLSWENQYCFFSSYDELEHGKEYYVKVRHGKYIDGETVYGEFSDPVKITVLKSIVSAYVPKIQIIKNGNGKKQILKITGNKGRNFHTMLYYSSKKDGKYRFILGSYLGKTDFSKIKELKKGKTWYVKARFCNSDSLDSVVTYGDFCKPKKLKVK